MEPHAELCSAPGHFKNPMRVGKMCIACQHIPPSHHSARDSSSDLMHDPNAHLDAVNGGKITL